MAVHNERSPAFPETRRPLFPLFIAVASLILIVLGLVLSLRAHAFLEPKIRKVVTWILVGIGSVGVVFAFALNIKREQYLNGEGERSTQKENKDGLPTDFSKHVYLSSILENLRENKIYLGSAHKLANFHQIPASFFDPNYLPSARYFLFPAGGALRGGAQLDGPELQKFAAKGPLNIPLIILIVHYGTLHARVGVDLMSDVIGVHKPDGCVQIYHYDPNHKIAVPAAHNEWHRESLERVQNICAQYIPPADGGAPAYEPSPPPYSAN